LIADQFRGPVLDDHPAIDGVMALTHNSGCGLVDGSEGAGVLLRPRRPLRAGIGPIQDRHAAITTAVRLALCDMVAVPTKLAAKCDVQR
jgi:hypothetical protein